MIEILKSLYKNSCEDLSLIDTMNKEELLELYKKNPEYSLKNDIPSVKFIIENFDNSHLNEHGIIIGRTFKNETLDWGISNKHKGVYVLNRCNGSLNFNGYEVLRLYISTGSDLTISISNNADIDIIVFGYSKVNVICRSKHNAIVVTNQYSKCFKSGNVKILNK